MVRRTDTQPRKAAPTPPRLGARVEGVNLKPGTIIPHAATPPRTVYQPAPATRLAPSNQKFIDMQPTEAIYRRPDVPSVEATPASRLPALVRVHGKVLEAKPASTKRPSRATLPEDAGQLRRGTLASSRRRPRPVLEVGAAAGLRTPDAARRPQKERSEQVASGTPGPSTARHTVGTSDAASSGGYGTRYYTFRKDVPLERGQQVAFARGRGYYARYPSGKSKPGTSSGSRVPRPAMPVSDGDARHLAASAPRSPMPPQTRPTAPIRRPQELSTGAYAQSGEAKPPPRAAAIRRFALSEADRIVAPEDFAILLLQYMNLPVNEKNVMALLQWESTEGGHWKAGASPRYSGYHNPLNTGFINEGHGPPTPNSSRPNGAAAQYPTWRVGLEATAYTLNEPQYHRIFDVLKKSEGGPSLRAALAATPSYGTIAAQWTTQPIGIYAYRDFRRSRFLYR